MVIPARDEERTVRGVVASLRPLRDEHGLIDELLVVDGGSRDATVAEAEAGGAVVVAQSQVLPGHGPAEGKGDALWRGVAVSSGDLVVFVDADVLDPDPGLVVGLLGPLLIEPAIELVKASYDRPLGGHDGMQRTGGGRVTELLARPVLATWWPQLSGLAQPLAGEYAARRDLLRAVPFVRGYGVELALLIDTLARRGPEAIAQVDLGVRRHEHQSLEALSRMAAELLHVATARLVDEGRATTPPGAVLRQPGRDADGRLRLVDHQIRWSELPPLVQVGPSPHGPCGPSTDGPI